MGGKVVLIDSMYLIFSSYYVNRHMRTMKGEPTGAVYGFVTRIESIIRELQPDYILAAFDSPQKSFRHQLYGEYKAKRMEPPEDLTGQIPLVKEYLDLRFIKRMEFPGFEADDIIACVARHEQRKNQEVYIYSADKDLFQLVNDRVFIYHPKDKEILDRQGIKNHFGLFPEQIVDFLSLTGDSSDNIPGVPGVGEKTALKLLERFVDINGLLNNLDQVDEKIRQKINNNRDLLMLSKQLIDLKDVMEKMDVEIQLNQFENRESHELQSFYQRLSFNSLLKKSEVEKDVLFDKFPIKYITVTSHEIAGQLKKMIMAKKGLAFDVETTHLDFFRGKLVGIGISFAQEGYYFPFLYPEAEKGNYDYNWQDFITDFKDIFEDPQIKKCGHNLKFDLLQLKSAGIETKGAEDDSMIMSYLLFPNRRTHNLKELALEFLRHKPVAYEDLAGKGKNQTSLDQVPVMKVSQYCIDDAYMSFKLIEILGKKIEENHLSELYKHTEILLIGVLINMEYLGIKVDCPFLDVADSVLKKQIGDLEQEIYRKAGYEFNINSPQQLGELLFEKMNLPIKKRTRKTHTYSTDIDVLMEYRQFPLVADIITYRTYKKLLSTYVEGLAESIDQMNRIHTSYNQTVTATGRLSSSNPNLQNIPVGEMGGINIRQAFIADSGYMLLSADYSQIELRVMAHFSKDIKLQKAFAQDLDIHQLTADLVFANDRLLSPVEKRRRAKIINFSILYGSGPYSLSKELAVSYGEAKQFIDTYFATYEGIRLFIDKTIAEAQTNPEVRTILGRRRDIPEITSANKTIQENGKRMAINTIIQGSAADIIKVAMINIHKKMGSMKARLILQVHDELVFEYWPDQEKELMQMVAREMENAIPLLVPLKVTFKKGINWGQMNPV